MVLRYTDNKVWGKSVLPHTAFAIIVQTTRLFPFFCLKTME